VAWSFTYLLAQIEENIATPTGHAQRHHVGEHIEDFAKLIHRFYETTLHTPDNRGLRDPLIAFILKFKVYILSCASARACTKNIRDFRKRKPTEWRDARWVKAFKKFEPSPAIQS